MINAILFFILGIAATIYGYETYAEKKEKKIGKLLSRKLVKLIEDSSMKIGERQKQLNRELTEEEKDNILDKCYTEI